MDYTTLSKRVVLRMFKSAQDFGSCTGQLPGFGLLQMKQLFFKMKFGNQTSLHAYIWPQRMSLAITLFWGAPDQTKREILDI